MEGVGNNQNLNYQVEISGILQGYGRPDTKVLDNFTKTSDFAHWELQIPECKDLHN